MDYEPPIDDHCPHCQHDENDHVPLDPQGCMTFPDPNCVACIEHFVDPVTGIESFCDCIWLKGPQARWLSLRAKYCEQVMGYDVQN